MEPAEMAESKINWGQKSTNAIITLLMALKVYIA